MLIPILDDGFPFAGKDPMRLGDDTVMLISLIFSPFPVVVFTRTQCEPDKHGGDRYTGSGSPVFQIADDFISQSLGDPTAS